MFHIWLWVKKRNKYVQHSVIIANFMGSLVSNNELVRKKEEDCGLRY